MRALGVAVALASALAAAQSPEYLDFKMVSSAQQPFGVYVDTRSATPAQLDVTLMQAAVGRAWNTWNAVSCAGPKVQVLGASTGVVPDPQDTYDAFSTTPVWLLSSSDPDFAEIFGFGLAGALTIPRAYAGVLQTCDVFFNGARSEWSLDSTTTAAKLDFETVMLHEAGHCLGLDHFNPDTAVMFGAVSVGTQRRTLSQFDVTALCERNPAPGNSGAPCKGDGGCDLPDLKCVQQPTTNGVTMSLCTRGCAAGTGANCDLPLTCQASNAFTPAHTGACLLPGSVVTQVGRACTFNDPCGSSIGFCRTPIAANSPGHSFWVDGYCTQSCEAGQPACPAGSTCTPIGEGRRCLQTCRVGLADCRFDYACEQFGASPASGVCVPRCYSDTDCADPLAETCRTCDGLCVPRQTVTAQVGDLCAVDGDCGPGQTCRATVETSGLKTCTQQCGRGCGSCTSGSTCTPLARGELFCVRDCTGPGTCPAGLRCGDTAVGKGCVPACTSNAECPVGQGCYLGECYTPTEDAGCGTLCNRPDAGRPIVPVPKDAGTGIGGTGGCGCTSGDASGSLALLGLLAALARRRAWRPR